MPEELIVSVASDARGFEPPFDEDCITANPHALAAALTDADTAGGPLVILRCTDGAGAPLALWPFVRRTFAPGVAILNAPPVPRYNLCGGPLIGANGSAACISAMLAHLKASSPGPRLLLINDLPADGLVWRALEDMASDGRIRISVISRWERPMFERSAFPDAPSYLAAALSAASRKRLRNKRRSLEAGGALRLIAHSGESVAAAFDTFLRLEASGWKGRAGSALRERPEEARYVRQVLGAMAAANRAWILEMRSGEKALATGLFLRCGSEASFWKTAYEEADGRYSPGVILNMMVTEWLYEQPWFVRMDTGCDDSVEPGSLLWKERQTMVNAVISLDPGSLPERLVVGALRLRHHARALKNRYLNR